MIDDNFKDEKCFTSEEQVNLLQMSNSETLKLIQKMAALILSGKEQNNDSIKMILKKIIWLTELLLEDMERENDWHNTWYPEILR
jgi:predicted metal-binding transcription factor (methanogenesis marker protein 9)